MCQKKPLSPGSTLCTWAFIYAFSCDKWKLQAASSNCRKSPDAVFRFYIKKGKSTHQHGSKKPVKVRTHNMLFINVMVQSKCDSCHVGRKEWHLSFYPVSLYSLCLTIFLTSFVFPIESSRSSQTAVYLPPYPSRYQCLSSLKTTSIIEQISWGSSVFYWQSPPSGHKIWSLGAERDLQSRAACAKKRSYPFFSYSISAVRAVWWLTGGFGVWCSAE